MQQDIICHVCSNGENEAQMLLCDGCNRGFHTFCLNMRSVPSGSWYCPGCVRSSSTTTTTTTKPKVEEPKTVFVYIRVSSAGQNQPEYGRVGMDTQNAEVLKFCMSHNLYVKSSTTEVGSAYHSKTPKLTKLIESLKPGMPIMVFSFNRFSRNVQHATEMINAIHAKGSYVWSVTDQMTSREAGFMSLIQAAENESRLNGQRVAAAHQRVIAQGGYTGKKPFGYNKVRVNGVFRLQENKLEQKIMKKIRDYAKLHPETKVLAFAISKYSRYEWNPRLIRDCIYDNVRENHSSGIIASNESESEMEEMMEAIEEVQDEALPNLYVIKRFHKIRFHNNVYEILVEWKGASNKGPNGSCTWENVVSLYEDASELVIDFLAKSKSVHVSAIQALL
jgi:DNA invertase Pin-like site-specific DNA recombinase